MVGSAELPFRTAAHVRPMQGIMLVAAESSMLGSSNSIIHVMFSAV